MNPSERHCMQTEIIQSRIEGYTSTLPKAVQSSQGAQFALLLSLISTNQSNSQTYEPSSASQQNASGEGFALPQASTYPSVDELHTPELVERLNLSVNENLPPDFAYVNSHIMAKADQPREGRPGTMDEFAKMALMSAGKLMLEQIEQSQHSISS